jgi:TolB protein
MQQLGQNTQGDPSGIQLTHLTGMSYDPVWSPDGSRIACISQEHTSDDIWVVNRDGSGVQCLTNNDWEWDKHPSWSPNSQEIVFWSNRTGLKQIYVMAADGSNARNISNTEWDEYDPIWLK